MEMGFAILILSVDTDRKRENEMADKKEKLDAVNVTLTDEQVTAVAEIVSKDTQKRSFEFWAAETVRRGLKSIAHSFDHTEKAKTKNALMDELATLTDPEKIAEKLEALRAMKKK